MQTLGIEHPLFNQVIRGFGPAVALVVVLGNSAIVVAVLLGLVHP
jgi:hypothetical protein